MVPWSSVRSRLKPKLELELRVCIELLWVLPGPEVPVPVAVVPSNMFVKPDGTLLLRAAESAVPEAEQRYLAPEHATQAAGTQAEAIYAVGVLLYEAVSGSLFESHAIASQAVKQRRVRASKTQAGEDFAELELLAVALKATQPAAEQRWATPESFSRVLARVAGERMAPREELAQFIGDFDAGKVVTQATPIQSVGEPARPRAFEPAAFVSALRSGSALRKQALESIAVPDEPHSRTLRGFALDLSGYPSSAQGAATLQPSSATGSEQAPTSEPVPEPVVLSEPASRRNDLSLPLERPRWAAVVTAALLAIPLAFMAFRGTQGTGLSVASGHAPHAAAPLPIQPHASNKGMAVRGAAGAIIKPHPAQVEPSPSKANLVTTVSAAAPATSHGAQPPTVEPVAGVALAEDAATGPAEPHATLGSRRSTDSNSKPVVAPATEMPAPAGSTAVAEPSAVPMRSKSPSRKTFDYGI